MKSNSVFVFLLFLASGSFAANITAINNGSWTSNSTWNLNRTPQNTDVVIIPAGLTVYFQGSPYSKANIASRPMLDIRISGVLDFSNAGNDKMYLDQGSTIQILSGGSISTSSSSTEIIAIFNGLADNTVWTGSPGSLNGPKSATGTSLGFTNALLPLTLVSFDLEKYGKSSVLLKWKTAGESNTSYFEIQQQHALNGNWHPVGSVGAAGHSDNELHYSFTCPAGPGVNQFRLKQVDIDGSFTYSPVRVLDLRDNVMKMYYSPAEHLLVVSGPTIQNSTIVLRNINGSLLFTHIIRNNPSRIQLPANYSSSIVATIYTKDAKAISKLIQ